MLEDVMATLEADDFETGFLERSITLPLERKRVMPQRELRR